MANTSSTVYTNYGLLALTTANNPPTTYLGTNLFILQVFDLKQNNVIPVESWSCTLLNNVDGFVN